MFKLTIFRSYVGSATLAIAAVAGALLAAVGMSAAHAQTCPFDSGGSTLENDGLVLTRYALGLRGGPMVANTSFAAADAATIEGNIACPNCGLSVTGDSAFTVADATIISRKIAGFSGAALTNGVALGSGTRNTPAAVQSFLLAGCGAGSNGWVQGGNAFGAPGVMGTTDGRSLTVGVGAGNGLRVIPSFVNSAPNIILGSGSNSISSASSVAGTTVGGGQLNSANGAFATISGGQQNSAAGNWATVAGGKNNVASGAYSFAAGVGAVADAPGSFVWGDSTTTGDPKNAFAANTFNVWASGGVRLIAGSNPDTGGSVGVFLSPGSGAWSSASDRNSKTAFSSLDVLAVLRKVVSMPIGHWSYKSELGVRHIGPMAQDFKRLFAVGVNDTSITTIDADGVALAAIQGLNLKFVAQAAKIKNKDAEIAKLKAKYDADIVAIKKKLGM